MLITSKAQRVRLTIVNTPGRGGAGPLGNCQINTPLAFAIMSKIKLCSIIFIKQIKTAITFFANYHCFIPILKRLVDEDYIRRIQNHIHHLVNTNLCNLNQNKNYNLEFHLTHFLLVTFYALSSQSKTTHLHCWIVIVSDSTDIVARVSQSSQIKISIYRFSVFTAIVAQKVLAGVFPYSVKGWTSTA